MNARAAIRPSSRRVVAAVVLAAGAVLAACGGTRVAAWEPRPGPYDRFAGDAEAVERAPLELARARQELDAGDADAARARLLELAALHPANLYVATALQDVELALLRTGGDIAELDRALETSGLPSDGSPQVRLRRWYRLRSENSDASGSTVVGEPARDGFANDALSAEAFALVLAARVENDAPSALLLLEQAVRADPDCVWAHLGRAHFLLREGELGAGRTALDRAIALDAGHPRVRRLEATLLERLGERDAARRLLETWIEEVAGDWRVPDGDVVDANLDLVTYDVEADRAERALARLDALYVEAPDRRARALLLRSAALAILGRYEDCLDAVVEARFLGAGSYLAQEHEARLLQDGLGDAVGALDAWRAVRELAGTLAPSSGAAALATLRARAEIERLERALRPNDAGLLEAAAPAGEAGASGLGSSGVTGP